MKPEPPIPQTQIAVIGAGMGGLAAAASLAKLGRQVTVLEAHIYPGGSAGTFFHQGYRFDAGATLAGGFAPNGLMDIVAEQTGVESWPVQPADLTMRVHLPGGLKIDRWSDERRWQERQRAFTQASLGFWKWQEQTADFLWDAAGKNLPWPPQRLRELFQLGGRALPSLLRYGSRHTPGWVLDALRPVRDRIPAGDSTLERFLDAQLLISAQTTSEYANALYAAAALDLPRRGVAHVEGGMGALAETLVQAIRSHGGAVVFRHEVIAIQVLENGEYLLETNKGTPYRAQTVIANLTPWNIAKLLGDQAPKRYRALGILPEDSWGAMMVYVGLEDNPSIDGLPLHQQVIRGSPLAEGNSIFLSLSPAWDRSRAPANHRALTISTHTRLGDWWRLHEDDRGAYEARKEAYVDRMMGAAEVGLPGLRGAARLILPGTPVTFQRFTRRARGWVGGFPQTNLFQAWPARVRPGFWMVGDSIFPGQSTPAVSLGGLRVAEAILQERTRAKRIIRNPDRSSIEFPASQELGERASLEHPPADSAEGRAADPAGARREA